MPADDALCGRPDLKGLQKGQCGLRLLPEEGVHRQLRGIWMERYEELLISKEQDRGI
jgi:hypothetical protein